MSLLPRRFFLQAAPLVVGLSSAFRGKSGAAPRAPETPATLPNGSELIKGIDGQPVEVLIPQTIFTRDLAKRDNGMFDALVIGLPQSIKSTKKSVDAIMDGDRAGYDHLFNCISQTMAKIMFLRGLSPEARQPIYDAMHILKDMNEKDPKVFSKVLQGKADHHRMYGPPRQEPEIKAFGKEQIINATLQHIYGLETYEDRQKMDYAIAAACWLPEEIIQSDDPVTDFDRWLDQMEAELEQHIKADPKSVLYSFSNADNKGIINSVKEHGAYVQWTERNFRIKATQLLLGLVGAGFTTVDSDSGFNPLGSIAQGINNQFPSCIRGEMSKEPIRTDRKHGGYELNYPYYFRYGNQPDFSKACPDVTQFFRVRETGNKRAPLSIEPVDHEVSGLRAAAGRMYNRLEAMARNDYGDYSLRLRFLATFKGKKQQQRPTRASTLSTASTTPTSTSAAQKRAEPLNTENLIASARQFQTAVSVVGVIAENWAQSIDDAGESIVSTEITVPEGVSIKDIALALEEQPAIIVEHDDRVFAVLHPDKVEDAEIVLEQTFQPA